MGDLSLSLNFCYLLFIVRALMTLRVNLSPDPGQLSRRVRVAPAGVG